MSSPVRPLNIVSPRVRVVTHPYSDHLHHTPVESKLCDPETTEAQRVSGNSHAIIKCFRRWDRRGGQCYFVLAVLQTLVKQKKSTRLELSISKKHPARKVQTRSWECQPKVPGRFAFPGARHPRICCVFAIREHFSSNLPGLSRSFPWVGKALDTFNFLRHVMRAILSARPKCSHRCFPRKETS